MALKQFCKTLEKCGDDEPIFVLRGQDVLAPMVVEYWGELAEKLGVNPHKILEAYQCAGAMRQYETRKVPD